MSFAEDEPPRIQTDVFLDLFDNVAGKLAAKPIKGPVTVHGIIETSAFCLVDGIPNPDSKATITFLPNVAQTTNRLAKAYLRSESDIFKALRNLTPSPEKAPVTLTLEWNMTEDPTQPFLEVVRLNSDNWQIN
ncbi:hypothetical protein N9Z02_01000 [Akkermansiaceae bacterium]|nr:hypothetical protein [Akkermansiaceae bacterium]